MKKVLLIGGCKQSGKSSTANFITGYQLKANGVTDKFEIDVNGNLWVNSVTFDEEGEPEYGMGELDLTRRDQEFLYYAQHQILPYCKVNNIADPLKETIHTLFGVSLDKLYGDDNDKNSDSGVPWKCVAKFKKGAAVSNLKKDGKIDRNLTIRELCIEFGDVCRTFDEDCFVRPCINDVVDFDEPFTVVPDCRFVNEINAFKQAASDGKFELKTLYLKRIINPDSHESEQLHNNYDINKFDAVIDNTEMSLSERNRTVLSHLLKWGWVNADMG